MKEYIPENAFFNYIYKKASQVKETIENNETFKNVKNAIKEFSFQPYFMKLKYKIENLLKEYNIQQKEIKRTYKMFKDIIYIFFPQIHYIRFIKNLFESVIFKQEKLIEINESFKHTKQASFTLKQEKDDNNLNNIFDIIEYINNLKKEELVEIIIDLEKVPSDQLPSFHEKILKEPKSNLRNLIIKNLRSIFIDNNGSVTLKQIKQSFKKKQNSK